MMLRTEALRWGFEAQYLEVDEEVTLVDNRFYSQHRCANGWSRETGMLERRREQRPVLVERRRAPTG